MSGEKCGVCEGYCPSTGCAGRPGYIRARGVRANHGWVDYTTAVAIEKGGGHVDWSDIWAYSAYGLQPEKDRIVIMDTETTHLNVDVAQMIEVAWAEPGGPVCEAIVEHNTHDADPAALRINRYNERHFDNPALWAPKHHYLPDIITAAVEGATILGSFVDYDRRIVKDWLATQFYYEPGWHHRPLEIGSYVAGRFGIRRSLSLAEAQALVATRTNRYLATPDHTAAGDVRAVESTWLALASA